MFFVLSFCISLPFTVSLSSRACGSGMSHAGTIHGPSGANVSQDLPWNQSNLNG
jgi:hypothetical protein